MLRRPIETTAVTRRCGVLGLDLSGFPTIAYKSPLAWVTRYTPTIFSRVGRQSGSHGGTFQKNRVCRTGIEGGHSLSPLRPISFEELIDLG